MTTKHAVLHQHNPEYGNEITSITNIIEICKNSNYKTILDFGCGKGALSSILARRGYLVWNYDPAIEEHSDPPLYDFDLVIVNHVLECINPTDILKVLDKIVSYARHAVLFNIQCGESKFTFTDGSNVNTIVQPKEYWIRIIKKINKPKIINIIFHEEKNNVEIVCNLHYPYYCYQCALHMIEHRDSWMCAKCKTKWLK